MTGKNEMSVSDRLAMRLKDSELGTLLSEDDIILVAREAIDKAFFKKRTETSGYNTREYEPLIVSIARTTFEARFRELADPVITEFMKSEEFVAAIAAAATHALPSVLMGMVDSRFYGAVQSAMEAQMGNYDFMRRFRQAMANAG